MMVDTVVKIELNSDEALVLFEFLSSFSDTDQLKIEDQAEKRVLWNIYSDLEKTLVEPFQENYAELLEAARTRTRDFLE
jgi:hypothetical protein